MTLTTPEQVAACFSRCTGIRLRYLSHNQFHLCAEFIKHFTLIELETVIIYVQRQIQVGKLDERSLAFRNILGEYGSGNEFATFQDRLSMAQKTVRVRPAPKQVPRTTDVGDSTITVLDFPAEPDVPPASDLIRQQFEQMKAANAKMRTGEA